MDQAASLRRASTGDGHITPTRPSPLKGEGTCDKGARCARVIAISSGKGGVGKTNSVVNLSVAFSEMGKKVLLLDADLGLGNIDVLLGLAPKYNIGHLLSGERTIGEVLVNGPSGILILPASSGVHELTNLSSEERLCLQSHLENMEMDIDILIIDTGAGISNNVLFFNMAAGEIVVVVTPEPTSITDAYALMKVMLKRHGERRFKLLVNTVKTKKEGVDVYRKISLAAERFLGISIDYIGCVLHDENVQRSVVRQRPVMELYPDTKASVCYREIAREICDSPSAKGIKGGMQFFWRQMLNKDF
ncbi:MAG: MinD/ParA family protein [Deltaproteobacteria bacterium]|nr:MinD/ParA family protein [Deltaproteobacteria bacterium]